MRAGPTVRYEGTSGMMSIDSPASGVVVLTIEGHDIGEFGSEPMRQVEEHLSGEIKPGMEVHIPCSPSFSIAVPVHEVEFVDGRGKRSEVGLTVQCEDEDELFLLEGLNIAEEEIEVCPPGADNA